MSMNEQGGKKNMKIPENIDSKYRYIQIVAKRCAQLQGGAKPKISTLSTKHAAIAQKEVADGLIGFKVIDEKEASEKDE